MLFLMIASKHTLKFLHSSLSVIHEELFKKIVQFVHIWNLRNFYLHFETKGT